MFNRRFAFRKAGEDGQPDDPTAYDRPEQHNLNNLSQRLRSSREGQLQAPKHQLRKKSDTKSDTSLEDPLGLHVIHRPQGSRKVDIVFVHGLGGTSRLTWSKYKDLSLFWPLAFLPMEADIYQSRIFTFGYDASFRLGSSKSAITILDFAKDLLFEMKYGKDELDELSDLEMGKSPIIFVVHSMGGLIVKEAYMQGQNDPNYELIVKSISAIIFLSTPHRGTNLAETLNRILQASFIVAPKQYISELTKNSHTLQKLNEQFRHVANRLDIVSFYETRTTAIGFGKNRIMVLEKDSSVLGYPGEISKPLDADHHGVCKYESRQDPLYITVRNVLKSLVNKLQTSPEQEDTQATPDRKRHESKVREFLSVYELPDTDYTFFRDRWTPGTCKWILEHSAFIDWFEGTDSEARLLWIYGSGASGKSVLSSYIIDHLIREGRQCQYFFIRFIDQHKRSLHTLLRSVAYQIARTIPAYSDKILKLAAEAGDLRTADVRNIWQWLYRSGIFTMQLETPLYWVFDGVDESDSPRTMVKLLSDLSAYAFPIRLLLVSRKTQELFFAFQRLAKVIRTDSIQLEGNMDDFRRFIEQELDDVAGNASYKSYITSLILERAEGNFLWIHLAVQRINKCVNQKDVEDAIVQLPPGMEALYNRMAYMIAENPSSNSKRLAHDILAWATCARRLMMVGELSSALGQDAPLDFQRSIGDLCGGFVVVDVEGKVALIHQTAREYLFSDLNQSLSIDKRSANELLFQKCMLCLTDPKLRVKINRNQEPDLLDYAASYWFIHLCISDPASPHVLPVVLRFLQAPYVLTWIQAVAKISKLRLLVLASQFLNIFVAKLKELEQHTLSTRRQIAEREVIEGWATDLVKIVGKFGHNLGAHPQAIYKLIPPFCPHDSITHQQFGQKEKKTLSVSGFSNSCWDDSLGRISLEQGTFTSAVLTAGNRIVILSLAGQSSRISIYHASTFEEVRQIAYPERVFKMCSNNSGNLLVTYGYLTTRVWDISNGECVRKVVNPSSRPWPHTFLFADEDNTVLVGCDDRRVRTLALNSTSSNWEIMADFDEQPHEGTFVNSPTCMALSPEGDQIVLGYRGHPVTLWEVDVPTPIGQYTRTLDSSKTTAEQSWGDVMQLAWHPFSGEVLGLYLEGILFKWQPFNDESKEVQAVANKLAINCDGSLCATGDANGTIKVYFTADFSLLYRLSSQDPILDLSFSKDSKRLYDVRGTYANVWEPNALVRLADSSEIIDRSSDSVSDTTSLVKGPTNPEHWFGRVDAVTAIGAQGVGSLYCYGTDEGIVNLCEVGRGLIGELERSKGFMSIEQITWSEDGRLVAFADLGGKVTIKSTTRSTENSKSWNIDPVMDIFIAVKKGGIKQLLFHPRADQLLVYMTTKLCAVSIPTAETKESPIVDTMSTLKWMCHPSSDEHLLGFGPDSIHVFGWQSLEETNLLTFHLSRSDLATEKLLSSSTITNSWEARETVGKPILTVDSTRILLQVSIPLSAAQKELHHLLFPVRAINPISNSKSSFDDPNNDELQRTIIPLEIDSHLRIPLSLLPGDRLIFLDEDYWLCTWRLPTSSNSSRRRGSTSTTTARLADVKRHYFLPGDWINSDSATLCCVMSDGTLLYPRNGDVAVIQSETVKL